MATKTDIEGQIVATLKRVCMKPNGIDGIIVFEDQVPKFYTIGVVAVTELDYDRAIDFAGILFPVVSQLMEISTSADGKEKYGPFKSISTEYENILYSLAVQSQDSGKFSIIYYGKIAGRKILHSQHIGDVKLESSGIFEKCEDFCRAPY